MAYRSNTASSIVDGFSLNPVPYPVLLFLGVISLFLGLKWYVSYEDIVESTEEGMGWLLMAAPLLLLFAVKWLSNFDSSGWWFQGAWDARRRHNYSYLGSTTETGASPWGVAALIVLLLVMMQYQSSFLETWFG